MSQSIPVLTLTVQADGDVTKRRFVRFDGSQVDAEGALAMGVATHDQEDGKDLAVDVIGTSVVETGGAIALEDKLVSDDSGRAIANPDAGGEEVLALPLETAGESGEFIEVLLMRG